MGRKKKILKGKKIVNSQGGKKKPMPFPSTSKIKVRSGALRKAPLHTRPTWCSCGTIVGSLRTWEEP